MQLAYDQTSPSAVMWFAPRRTDLHNKSCLLVSAVRTWPFKGIDDEMCLLGPVHVWRRIKWEITESFPHKKTLTGDEIMELTYLEKTL